MDEKAAKKPYVYRSLYFIAFGLLIFLTLNASAEMSNWIKTVRGRGGDELLPSLGLGSPRNAAVMLISVNFLKNLFFLLKGRDGRPFKLASEFKWLLLNGLFKITLSLAALTAAAAMLPIHLINPQPLIIFSASLSILIPLYPSVSGKSPASPAYFLLRALRKFKSAGRAKKSRIFLVSFISLALLLVFLTAFFPSSFFLFSITRHAIVVVNRLLKFRVGTFVVFSIVFLVIFLNRGMSSIHNFLNISKQNAGADNIPYTIKHPRSELLRFLSKVWAFIFVTAFFSFGFLWAIMVYSWFIISHIVYSFAKLWKYHGYSRAVLISATAVFALLSFLAAAPLRDFMSGAFFGT